MYSFKDKLEIPLTVTVNTQYQRELWCLHIVRQMYRHNPYIIQPAFARVTYCKWSTSYGSVCGWGKQPSGVDGHPHRIPIPDLAGWDRPFCPGPAHGLGTTQSVSALQKVRAGAWICHWPSDQEQAPPREVTAPEILFSNNNLLCFTY